MNLDRKQQNCQADHDRLREPRNGGPTSSPVTERGMVLSLNLIGGGTRRVAIRCAIETSVLKRRVLLDSVAVE